MAQFAFLYLGEPHFDDPEEAKAHQQEWFAYIGSLGDAVVTPGMPMGPATRITAAGVEPAPTEGRLTGLTVVNAEDMDAAVEMAKTCPFVQFGTVDVVEVFQMG